MPTLTVLSVLQVQSKFHHPGTNTNIQTPSQLKIKKKKKFKLLVETFWISDYLRS